MLNCFLITGILTIPYIFWLLYVCLNSYNLINNLLLLYRNCHKNENYHNSVIRKKGNVSKTTSSGFAFKILTESKINSFSFTLKLLFLFSKFATDEMKYVKFQNMFRDSQAFFFSFLTFFAY